MVSHLPTSTRASTPSPDHQSQIKSPFKGHQPPKELAASFGPDPLGIECKPAQVAWPGWRPPGSAGRWTTPSCRRSRSQKAEKIPARAISGVGRWQGVQLGSLFSFFWLGACVFFSVSKGNPKIGPPVAPCLGCPGKTTPPNDLESLPSSFELFGGVFNVEAPGFALVFFHGTPTKSAGFVAGSWFPIFALPIPVLGLRLRWLKTRRPSCDL